MRASRFTMALAAGLLALHPPAAMTAEAPPGLFLAAPEPATAAAASRARYEIRHRTVAVDPAQLAAARDGAAQTLRLNFFDDAIWDVAITRVIARAADRFTLIGNTAEGEPGSFMLVHEQGVVLINARSGEAAYQLRHRDGRMEVRQVDMAQFPPCGAGDDCGECAPVPPPVEPAALALGDAQPPVVATDSGDLIDVMVVYTPAARAAMGGSNAMNALITLAVDESNQAYANSGVTPRLRLVHRSEVTYTEVDFSTDLNRLRGTADGFMDNVHALRNQYGADMVSLINNRTEFCGIGYLMTTLSAGFAANAFSVVYWDCATGYYSFAHELGHNMGCQHAVGDSGLTRSDPALYPYAYGWRFNGTTWRTIMAYAPGTRIQHFSNPNVTYGGFATGVATGLADQAYNALVINNVATTVANWRSGVAVVTPPLSTNVSLGATATFSVTASGTAPIGYQWRKDGTNLLNGGRISGAQSPTLGISIAQPSDAGAYSCRVTNLFSSAESAAATLGVFGTGVSLVITSAFAAVSPPPGTWLYPVGSNLTCRATSSPAVQADAQGQRTGICTGWVGTGSVPAMGSATTVTFTVTNDTTLAWGWLVTDWALSNQVVAVSTGVTARDTITAGNGYRVVSPGDVTLQAGQRVRLAPGFSAGTGGTFRARAGP